ncbi:MAG TPA: DUF1127 domain-containing protein [Citreicella sp.]|jgi:hypothetical protein|uniref:DUF1127 domain-containing protein n=1 Tax=Salipiger marinus TaxID=555512 RepID=A0A1G8MGU1_9RHOB|nr:MULTISPECIES: DUF1127 domain-containing protein [Salipiger]MCD1617639.1 DUF1127 domain-containing protein [Salipiger manganoxidans]SDI67169.1 hypothetical protein SAMN04487993_100843 [Salipiger marinus]HBM60121.1 DUF1127 domain-containing protein [Citreicella sp.]HBT00670.1 DUF1127 domain-containing protein [Citreicella sp.]|tara:strand:+ start:139 stop:363 length:225 start_codon:yes stop_codon:yes gene_type:complete
MAFLTASASDHTTSGSAFGRFFSAIGNALVAIGEANPRLRRVEALQRLSDEQLAARGLKREDIVRHVFRDVFYL